MRKKLALLCFFVGLYVPICLGQKLDIDTICENENILYIAKGNKFILFPVDSNSLKEEGLYRKCAIKSKSYSKYTAGSTRLFTLLNNKTGNNGFSFLFDVEYTFYYSRFNIGISTGVTGNTNLLKGLEINGNLIPQETKVGITDFFYKFGYALIEKRKYSIEPYVLNATRSFSIPNILNENIRGYIIGLEFNFMNQDKSPIIYSIGAAYDFRRFSIIHPALGDNGLLFRLAFSLKRPSFISKNYYAKIN